MNTKLSPSELAAYRELAEAAQKLERAQREQHGDFPPPGSPGVRDAVLRYAAERKEKYGESFGEAQRRYARESAAYSAELRKARGAESNDLRKTGDAIRELRRDILEFIHENPKMKGRK